MRILCRRSMPCLFAWVTITVTVCIVSNMFFGIGLTGRPRQFKDTCNMTSEYLTNLERLMQRVHLILDHHNIDHWLCYGTLWGQIRVSGLLATSERAYFCLLTSQLDRIEEGLFYHSFQSEFLKLRHYSGDGVYTIERNQHRHPMVELIPFARDEEQNVYKRVGWKRRLLPPNCEWTPSLDCFPTNLIQQPLPLVPFGRYSFPVPMGGTEMQKYHYTENWWKIVVAKNCNL